MRRNAIDAIAKVLGRLQGQSGIDESTRLHLVSEVEDAIRASSRQLDEVSKLEAFRRAAKATRNDWLVLEQAQANYLKLEGSDRNEVI